MADDEQATSSVAATSSVKDIRYDYIRDRVCSCLKVPDTAFEKLISGDGR